MSSVKGCFSICHFLVMFGAGEAHPSLWSLFSSQPCPPGTPAWTVDSPPTAVIISAVIVHSFGDSHLHGLSCQLTSTFLCGHQWWQRALSLPGPDNLATLITGALVCIFGPLQTPGAFCLES